MPVPVFAISRAKPCSVATSPSPTGGTILTFYLDQKHGGWNSDDNQNQNLGRFRLSITTAPGAWPIRCRATCAKYLPFPQRSARRRRWPQSSATGEPPFRMARSQRKNRGAVARASAGDPRNWCWQNATSRGRRTFSRAAIF